MPEQVAEALQTAGLRAEADLRNEKITYKIREHSLQKLPYQVIVGDKEMAAQTGCRANPQRRRPGPDVPGRPSSSAFKAEARQMGRAA